MFWRTHPQKVYANYHFAVFQAAAVTVDKAVKRHRMYSVYSGVGEFPGPCAGIQVRGEIAAVPGVVPPYYRVAYNRRPSGCRHCFRVLFVKEVVFAQAVGDAVVASKLRGIHAGKNSREQ